MKKPTYFVELTDIGILLFDSRSKIRHLVTRSHTALTALVFSPIYNLHDKDVAHVNNMPDQAFYICKARSDEDIDAVSQMFQAYALSLGIDLAFQGFEAEMQAMPGKYAPPRGELLLARRTDTDVGVGCVGLRPLEIPGQCEMKRLYVPPTERGLGVGKALVDAVVEVAKEQGYDEMRLDTLPTMGGAQALYRQTGFVEIAKYYETPLAETVFMALKLQGRGNLK